MPIQNIEDQLRRDEGEVLHEYKDHLGFSSLGIGILIDKRKGGGITKEESSYLFNNRLLSKTVELRRKFPGFDNLDSVRQGALLNMAYQLGVEGLLKFKKMFAAIEVENFRQAAREMRNSKWALLDTPARAERLAKQMESGVWQ